MGITQSKRLRLRKSTKTVESLPPDLLLEPDRDPITAFSQFCMDSSSPYTGGSFDGGITRNDSISSIHSNSITDSSVSRSSRSTSPKPNLFEPSFPVIFMPPPSPPRSWQRASATDIIDEEITYHPQDLKGILAGMRSEIRNTRRYDQLFHFGDALEDLLDTAMFTGKNPRIPDNDSDNIDRIPDTDLNTLQKDEWDEKEQEKTIIEILDFMLLISQTRPLDDDGRMRALSLLQRIKLERTRMFGADDTVALTATGWLAITYYQHRKWAEAETAAAEFVAKDEGRLDKWDSKVLFFFAKLYIRQGKWVKVEPVLEELEARAGSPDVVGQRECLESMLDGYIAQEKWSKVRELMEKHDHLKDGRKMDFIAALIGQESWSEARRAIGGSYGEYTRSNPIAYPDDSWMRREPSYRYMLALIYLGRQKWERSEAKFSGIIQWDRWHRAIRKSNWRQEDWRNLQSARRLCEAYIGLKKDSEAERLLLQVIEGSKSGLGAADIDTLDAMDVLASFYASKERWNEAEQLISTSIESRKELNRQGPSHPATLRSMEVLAKVYMGMARWEEAATVLEDIVAKRDALTQLGPDHPHTFRSIDLLSQVYRKLERWREMDGLRRRMLRARTRN